MHPVELMLVALGIYLGLGVLFAAGFVVMGVGRVDPAARGAGPVFRLFIAPGVAALWPVMLAKWVRA